MSRSSVLILVGILILFVPFSGTPSSWQTVLIVIFSIVVIGIGFLERTIHITHMKGTSSPVIPTETVSEPASEAKDKITSASVTSDSPHDVSPI